MKDEILDKIFARNRVPREIIIKAFYEYIGSVNSTEMGYTFLADDLVEDVS